MELHSFDGCSHVEREEALLGLLRSVRRGPYGAFILSHGDDESLWVHINEEAAFLWFMPDCDGIHPGFVPDGMWSGARTHTRFLQTNGSPADAIVVSWWQLLPVEAAYRAAVEYLRYSERPPSVSWIELWSKSKH